MSVKENLTQTTWNLKKKKKDHLNEHRKSIWKNPTPFYDTNTKNVRIEGNFLNMIGGIYEKPTANFIFNCKILKAFSLRSGTRQGCSLLWLLETIITEVLARAIQQEKEIKSIQIERSKVISTYRWHA